MEKIREAKGAYIAASAEVMGDVTLGEGSSVWYQSVVRGDHTSIRIGSGSNIQDGCVLHGDEGFPVEIGDGVTIGHRAVIHGCRIGDHTLIGMGAIILNGAKIGRNCIIGAGALVTGGCEIPDGTMALGSPAKVRRALTEEEIMQNKRSAAAYVECAREHFS